MVACCARSISTLPLIRDRWRRESAAHGFLAFDLALRLTLLDLVLRPVGNWLIRPLILSLAVVALLKTN